MQQFLIPAKPDLQAAREGWLKMLSRERRLAALTLDAYERDTRQFLHFLTGHLGGAPGLADVGHLGLPISAPSWRAAAPAAPARARSGAASPGSARCCAISSGAALPMRRERRRCARPSSRNRCPSR